ncbi:MAG: hypothetical protein ACLR3S_02460 [Clostridium fessum]
MPDLSFVGTYGGGTLCGMQPDLRGKPGDDTTVVVARSLTGNRST